MGRGTPVLLPPQFGLVSGPITSPKRLFIAAETSTSGPGHGTPLISVLSNPLATLASNKFRKKRRFRYPDNLDVAP